MLIHVWCFCSIWLSPSFSSHFFHSSLENSPSSEIKARVHSTPQHSPHCLEIISLDSAFHIDGTSVIYTVRLFSGIDLSRPFKTCCQSQSLFNWSLRPGDFGGFWRPLVEVFSTDWRFFHLMTEALSSSTVVSGVLVAAILILALLIFFDDELIQTNCHTWLKGILTFFSDCFWIKRRDLQVKSCVVWPWSLSIFQLCHRQSFDQVICKSWLIIYYQIGMIYTFKKYFPFS